MADEVLAGDVLLYQAGLDPNWTALAYPGLQIGGTVANGVPGNMQASIASADGPNFALEITSLTNRARAADIKSDLDNLTFAYTTGALKNSSISFQSQVTRGKLPPVTPAPGGNIPAPSPVNATPSFIASLASQIGVSEQTMILILIGGLVAVVMMGKK
jgi:hypothetical protein